MASNSALFPDIHSALRQSFLLGKTKSYSWRLSQLKALKKMLTERMSDIIEAMGKDLGRGYFETEGLECLAIIAEIDHAISNLKAWMKPTFTNVPAMMAPATAEYVNDPLGVCLIIGPFNYPINLLITPLAGAIAAGNCAVIKPSELSTACEQLMARLIPAYMDSECIQIVTGGIQATTALLDLQWDKIFFTGSTRVGKIVLQAAAKHLTPVGLELGGKSPAIVDESVTDLSLAARRIMWGKLINSGQTCIAPDYVLCHASKYDEFIKKAVETVREFYGSDPQQSPDFGRIVSTGHCERLKGLLDDQPGKIVIGGVVDPSDRYVSPTIISEARLDSKLMSDEIFGPLLPVIKYDTIDEALRIINSPQFSKPLVLYIFSKDRTNIDYVTSRTTSGDVVVNDVVFHFASPFLPFGGVGTSGIGDIHGWFSFEAFSHRRIILRRDDHGIFDIPYRYPPYTKFGLSVFKLAGKLPATPSIQLSTLGVVLGSVLAAIAVGSFVPELGSSVNTFFKSLF